MSIVHTNIESFQALGNCDRKYDLIYFNVSAMKFNKQKCRADILVISTSLHNIEQLLSFFVWRAETGAGQCVWKWGSQITSFNIADVQSRRKVIMVTWSWCICCPLSILSAALSLWLSITSRVHSITVISMKSHWGHSSAVRLCHRGWGIKIILEIIL